MSTTQSTQNNKIDNFRIAVVGTGAVGKSAITIQFTHNVFDSEEVYDPTIEDAYYAKRQIDGKPVELEIVDTAGQDDYIALRDTYMKNCFGFLLVFDITQELTLQELTKFVEQIKRIKEAQEEPLDFPCVIVGNKCDLNYKLTEKEIYNFIKNNLELSNAVPLFLTSAKNRVNIDETFEALVKEMRKKRRAMEI
ncbi:hypothetical protein ABK040_003954 [Willaertia magna]